MSSMSRFCCHFDFINLSAVSVICCLYRPLPSNSDIQEWRNWVNSHLVHVLVSNVYRTPGECVQVPAAAFRNVGMIV
jgi:uncharacterized lipoprotein YddW (UPF0748 family)